MKQLRLYFLGPFRAEVAGQPVDGFAYDKVRALLAYLAVEQHAAHGREFLGTLLWPETNAEVARMNLRKALSTLRKALCKTDAAPYLLVERDSVQFNPESNFWLDVDELKSRLDTYLNNTHLQFEALVHDLEEAAELYRGSFLQNLIVNSLEFEEWLLIIRENLQTRMISALHELSQYYLRQGEYGLAQKHALRQVEMEPYREEAHRTLMLCLARNGQRSAALARYARCKQILEEELGIEPSVETRALYERICSAGEASPHNLPACQYPLVGRESELHQIGEHLANPDCRLLTLVGMGGIGKTSLAISAAREQLGVFLHGVFYVPLAAVRSAALIVPAIAEALCFHFSGPRPLDVQLLDFVGNKELLLVLDNFEHLVNGEKVLIAFLEAAPHLKLLVTSRERLKLRSEWVIQLEGLTCPPIGSEDSGELESFSAVKCFYVIGRHLSRGLLDSRENRIGISRICRLTSGVPLAIALAASWAMHCSPTQIANEIERNLDALTTILKDVPLRQRSMRAAFEHSWALLSPEEQDGLKYLTVFQGGFDQVTARQATGVRLDLLTALLDKNLIQRQNTSRFALHPLVSQYAAEKLAAFLDTEKATRDRHCNYFAGLLAKKAAEIRKERQQSLFDELDIEFDNLVACWHYAIRARCWMEIDLALEGLFLYYEFRSRFREGQENLEKALIWMRVEGALSPPQLRTLGRLLVYLGRIEIYLGQYERADELLSESLEILKGFPTTTEYASALGYIGIACHYRGQYPQAQGYANASLCLSQQTGDKVGEAFCLNLLGNLAQMQGDFNLAKGYFQRHLALREELRDGYGAAIAYNNLGNLAHAQGDFEDAYRCYERSCASFEQNGHLLGLAAGLSNAGSALIRLGKTEDAQQMLERSLQIKRDLGQPFRIAITLLNLGELACETEKYKLAEEYLRESMRIARQVKMPSLIVELLACFAILFMKQGKNEAAVEILSLAENQSEIKQETKNRVSDLLSTVKSSLPEREFIAAQERGTAMQLESVERLL